MRVLAIVLAALLYAGPALAQDPSALDRANLYALRDEAAEAYRGGDEAAGDEACVELRTTLAGTPHSDSSQLTAIRRFVDKFCPRVSSPSGPASVAQPSNGVGSRYDPWPDVPASLSSDATMVWGMLASSQNLMHADAQLSVDDPVRIANFKRARVQCNAGGAWANGAGPGAQAMLDVCVGSAEIALNDVGGCATIRGALPGLSTPAAVNGPFAARVGLYREAALKTLEIPTCKRN